MHHNNNYGSTSWDGELPKIPPHMQGTVDTNTASAPRLVTFYSEVYAYWSGKVTACKTSGDTSSAVYTWASYYSDLSSRAAHYYNNIVENPPPPTASNSENKSQSRFAPKVTSQPQTAPAPAPGPSSTQGPPKSFIGYAHRCLSQCTTETQRNSMKEMVEMTIRMALQNECMHDKNWNVEPLLPLYQETNKTSNDTDADTAASGKSYANAVSNSFANQGRTRSETSSLSRSETSDRSGRMHVYMAGENMEDASAQYSKVFFGAGAGAGAGVNCGIDKPLWEYLKQAGHSSDYDRELQERVFKVVSRGAGAGGEEAGGTCTEYSKEDARQVSLRFVLNAENIQKGEVLNIVSTFKYKRLLPEAGGETSD
jgi:hypothetical protein